MYPVNQRQTQTEVRWLLEGLQFVGTGAEANGAICSTSSETWEKWLGGGLENWGPMRVVPCRLQIRGLLQSLNLQ
jgi:hypothetical protein